MDEKKQKFIDETNAYIKKKKTTSWICTAFIVISVALIFVGTLFVEGPTGSTVFAIGFFFPAIYTLPSAIISIVKNTPEIEPSYDLYISSNGRIYAKEDAYTQGARAGVAIGAIIKLLIISIIAPVRVFMIIMKCESQIKKAKKQLESIGA